MPVNVNPIMAAIVEAADTLNIAPDDYINPDDGLKYCGKCHTPKEAYFPEQYRKNGLDKHPIACKCAAEERARREAEQRELERLNRIAMLRSEAFRDIPAAGWRFENAEVMTPQLVKARRYSENWNAFRQDGTGQTVFSCNCLIRCSFLPIQKVTSACWKGRNLPLAWGKICPQVRKRRRKQIPVRITGERTPAAVLGSIRMFFFWTVNWPICNRYIPANTRITSTGCRPIWPPAESTTPTITPQFASGWTRTANRSPEKITTIQRPMRKENACECRLYRDL